MIKEKSTSNIFFRLNCMVLYFITYNVYQVFYHCYLLNYISYK